jgi:antitoxin (DNA-binding transcriptional repressor) of toxin-antitoxin stability system
MAATARGPSPNRIELSVNEARTRFLQLIRLTRVTNQETVVVDQGQPVAVIVSPDVLADRQREPVGTNLNAAGWLQRLETVRRNLHRQHDAHSAQLIQALDEAWNAIDSLRPPGADRRIDTLRTTHAPLRRRD